MDSTYTKNANGGRTYTDNSGQYRGNQWDYISSRATPQQYKNVYQNYGIIPNDNNRGLGSESDGGYYDRSIDLRAMWDEWRDTQLASLKKMYENVINGINQNFMSERNQANIKRKLGENQIKSNAEYDSGRLYKLTNANQNQWFNATMNARNEKSRATNTATTDYNNQKANVLQAYATRMANLL